MPNKKNIVRVPLTPTLRKAYGVRFIDVDFGDPNIARAARRLDRVSRPSITDTFMRLMKGGSK